MLTIGFIVNFHLLLVQLSAKINTIFAPRMQQIAEAKSWQEFDSTQRRVEALRHRSTVRDVRDAELKGYGVRVMPSGTKRYFHPQPAPGSADLEDRWRRRSHDRAGSARPSPSLLASLRDGRYADAEATDEGLFETIAAEVFARYGVAGNLEPSG